MSENSIVTPCEFGEKGNILLERLIGEGGMGGVYMGRDKMLDRAVAVKIMLKQFGSDAQFVEKFQREAQSAARLMHPNIAQIFSYGISDGMPYISMELVPGGSLYTLMKNSPAGTDVPRVLKICEQIAQALRCASDQGVVHGDIKPENILFDANGNAKLVDFGLAAMQKDTTEIWGTPYYIAPEKVNKQAVDFRADMYSLGGTLYHALTGVAPFEGTDADAVVRKRFEGPCKKPSELREGLSSQVDDLVMRMLAFNKEDRFPSFEALLDAMKKVLASGLSTNPSAVSGNAQESSKPKLKIKSGKRVLVKKPKKISNNNASMDNALHEQSEEGDSAAAKLGLVIFGVIAAILTIAGLLSWYVYANKKARERERIEQIQAGFVQAEQSIKKVREQAEDYQKRFDEFAEKATIECQKTTDEMSKLFPQEIAAMLKPAPTKELLDAIESTKPVAENPDGVVTSAPPATAAAPVAAASSTAPSPAGPQNVAVKSFRAPTDDEADPNSPQGQDYLKAKAEWEEKQKASAGSSGEVSSPQGENEVDPTPKMEIPQEVGLINDLWVRAYTCKACAIIIHHKIDQLIKKIDEYKPGNQTEETLQAYGDFSTRILAEFDEIKGSEEFTKVQKGISYISSKGKKVVDNTIKRLRAERLAKEREDKKREEEEKEKRRMEELAAAKAKRIEEEKTAINEKFTALTDAGVFRQLDWKGAKRQLNALKGDFLSAEGAVEADTVIRKVDAMELVQTIMIRNMKDFVFERGRQLRGMKVLDVNEKEIKLLKRDNKSTMKMNWPRFYRDCHGNLNELINTFVVRGRRNGKPKLRPKDWCEAMFGVALTMQTICSDDPASAKRAEQIAKEAVKQFDIYKPLAQQFFPEMDFTNVKAED